jgi:hypothetical protein
LAVVAVAAMAFGALPVNSASAFLPGSVVIAPAANLTGPSQVVHVWGDGYNPGPYTLQECVQGGTCDPTNVVPVTADVSGQFGGTDGAAFTMNQQFTPSAAATSVNCIGGAACELRVLSGTDTATGQLISFTAESVATVAGHVSGFTAPNTAVVQACPHGVTTPTCTPLKAPVNPSGDYLLQLAVGTAQSWDLAAYATTDRQYRGNGQLSPIQTETLSGGQQLTGVDFTVQDVPLQPGNLMVTPSNPLHAGDLVSVSGSHMPGNRDFLIYECAGTDFATCDTTTGPGAAVHTNAAGFFANGPASFNVKQVINGTTTCGPAQCYIEAFTGTPPQAGAGPVPMVWAGYVPATVQGTVTGPGPDYRPLAGFVYVFACPNGNADQLINCPGYQSMQINNNQVYRFFQSLPASSAGQAYDVAAYQFFSYGPPSAASNHVQLTIHYGDVITQNFTINGPVSLGGLLTGSVKDLNNNDLPAGAYDPYGGPGGNPITGVLACPGNSIYGVPGSPCNGANVWTTPVDSSGNYRMWLGQPPGPSTPPPWIWNTTAYSFYNSPGGTQLAAIYRQMTCDTSTCQPVVGTTSVRLASVASLASSPSVDFILPMVGSGPPPTLTYVSPTVAPNGATVPLSGTLVTSGGTPIGGVALTLTFGTQSCAATTDPTGVATCPITVNQAQGPAIANAVLTGNPDLAPSIPVAVSVGAPQTITFGPLTNRAFGDPPLTVAATASSGLPVTFTATTPSVCTSSGTNGKKITIVGGGTCTVQADQAGNTTYAPAPPVQQSFTVARANQWILFLPILNRTMVQSPVTALAVATSGLPVAFTTTTPLVCTASGTNGRTIMLVGAGVCTVTASQAGNANYNPASTVTRSFTVSKANQMIAFGTIANRKLTQSPFAVSATASSGLAVTFNASPSSVCTVSGTTFTLHHTGTCTITAHQGGNSTWNPATDVSRSFRVT